MNLPPLLPERPGVTAGVATLLTRVMRSSRFLNFLPFMSSAARAAVCRVRSNRLKNLGQRHACCLPNSSAQHVHPCTKDRVAKNLYTRWQTQYNETKKQWVGMGACKGAALPRFCRICSLHLGSKGKRNNQQSEQQMGSREA